MRKSVFKYFKKSVAFFDLRVKSIPPVVFLILLAIYLLIFYFSQINSESYDALIEQFKAAESPAAPDQPLYLLLFAGILFQIPANIVSYIYLSAAILDTKKDDYTVKICVSAVLRKVFRLAAITIIKSLALILFVLFAIPIFILLVIPVIYLSVMTIFAECAVLDGKSDTAFGGFKFSMVITKRRRGEIFFIMLFCNLLLMIFMVFFLYIFNSNNAIVFTYISIFIMSLLTLIEHKLTALLYSDALESYEYMLNGGGDGSADNNDGGGDGSADNNDGGGDTQ